MIKTNDPYWLNGKQILITGASSGIGKATAIECSRKGARLTITGRNDLRLQETFKLLDGKEHAFVPFDMTDEKKVSDLISTFPSFDGIVHCAGTLETCPVKFIQKENMNNIFETNFYSVVHLMTQLLNTKKINRSASIVFISSVAVQTPKKGNAVYSASKAALSAYAKTMALELSMRKIRVNCICPAMVKTPFLNKCSIDDEQFTQDEKKYPLGYGEPEDVAWAALYLLSDAARWITGTNMLLDGGLNLQ